VDGLESGLDHSSFSTTGAGAGFDAFLGAGFGAVALGGSGAGEGA
jgi:hypothetical protein